jgi:hypothetical protein
MLGRLGRHPLHPVTSARECTHTAKESVARGLDDGALVAADAIFRPRRIGPRGQRSLGG